MPEVRPDAADAGPGHAGPCWPHRGTAPSVLSHRLHASAHAAESARHTARAAVICFVPRYFRHCNGCCRPGVRRAGAAARAWPVEPSLVGSCWAACVRRSAGSAREWPLSAGRRRPCSAWKPACHPLTVVVVRARIAAHKGRVIPSSVQRFLPGPGAAARLIADGPC